jgi:hypothetical protein
VILGLIVQAVSGQSYEDYLKQHIFAPLEMHNSFVSQDDALQAGMAMGHRWWFGIPIAVTMPFNRSNLPAGFAIASAEDMAHFLIAQLNGGRYGENSVLSPAGIALMQTEPASKSYGLGLESMRINGRRLVNQDGGNANFQCSFFFDPEARVGVFVAANAMSTLDAFSSPAGSSLVDGITTRGMALSILSLVTKQPMPDQGLGHRRLTVLFNLVLLTLTVMLIVSLARLPGRHQRLAQRGIASWSDLLRYSGRTAVWHFTGPLLLLYLARKEPSWFLLVLFQPDLVYWLEAVALVLSGKGLLEIALAWRVFWQTDQRQRLQPEQDSHSLTLR